MNDFGLRLYRLAGAEGNLLLSPPSAALPLSLAGAGARGKTRSEILQAFGFVELDDASWVRGLSSVLNRNQKGCELFGSNHAFVVNSLPVLPSFLSFLEGSGHTELEGLSGGNEEKTEQINRRIREQTRGRIPNLLPYSETNFLISLVLASAVSFDGAWKEPFSREQSSKGRFRLLSGQEAEASMMQARRTASFARLDTVSILEMPFGCDELSMVFLLPETGEPEPPLPITSPLGLSLGGRKTEAPEESKSMPSSQMPMVSPSDALRRLEKEMSAEKLEQWLSALQPTHVSISIPKFSIGQKWDLRPSFEELGVKSAFALSADFSGVSEEKPLNIASALHSAVLEIDEEGTRAAAGSLVMFKRRGMPPDVKARFHVDRPFLFLVRDKPSGVILFLGKVVDPRSESQDAMEVDPMPPRGIP